MRKFLGFMLIILLTISCTTITKRDRELVKNVEIEKQIKKAIDKNKEVQDNNIYIYQGKEKIGKLTKKEWKTLIQVSKYYEVLLDAEKDGRVFVFFNDNPWKLKPGQVISTKIDIIWKTKDKLELKKLVLKLNMEVPKDGKAMSKLRVMYRDVCEYLAPISLATLIIVLGLVLGL